MSVPIEIQLPFGAGQDFHCPVCGTNFSQPERDDRPGSCPHLLFTFLESESLMVYAAPSVAQALEAAGETKPDVEDLDEGDANRFIQAIADRSPVVFRVSGGGMACGPVWFTTVYALDFTRPHSKQLRQTRDQT